MTREMIDRAAVREALREVDAWTMPIAHAIAALPAVTVGVPVAHAYIVEGECEQIEWGAEYCLPDDPALTMLYALDITPAPVTRRIYMGQIMAECDCPRSEECEAAQRCLAETPAPAQPDPAAIREAAELIARVQRIIEDWEEQASERDPRDPMKAQIYREASDLRAALALIQKEPTDDRA